MSSVELTEIAEWSRWNGKEDVYINQSVLKRKWSSHRLCGKVVRAGWNFCNDNTDGSYRKVLAKVTRT